MPTFMPVPSDDPISMLVPLGIYAILLGVWALHHYLTKRVAS
jgi:hypothetical protein